MLQFARQNLLWRPQLSGSAQNPCGSGRTHQFQSAMLLDQACGYARAEKGANIVRPPPSPPLDGFRLTGGGKNKTPHPGKSNKGLRRKRRAGYKQTWLSLQVPAKSYSYLSFSLCALGTSGMQRRKPIYRYSGDCSASRRGSAYILSSRSGVY